MATAHYMRRPKLACMVLCTTSRCKFARGTCISWPSLGPQLIRCISTGVFGPDGALLFTGQRDADVAIGLKLEGRSGMLYVLKEYLWSRKVEGY